MFKFLKDKIKSTVEKFSSSVEKEEVSEEDLSLEEEKELVEDESLERYEESKSENSEDKKGFFKNLFSKKEKEEEITEPKEVKEEVVEVVKEEKPEPVLEEKKQTTKPIVEEKKEEALKQEAVSGEPKAEAVAEKSVIEDKKKEEKVEEKEEPKVETEEQIPEPQETAIVDATKKKKGFFSKIKEKIVKFKLNDEKFEELFWDFELGLLESNVAVSVIEKIKSDLKEKLTTENVSKKGIEDVIIESLKNTFDEILSIEGFDLVEKIKNSEKPFVISMIGVNGSGKTTTLAKLIKKMQDNNLSVVVAASDTFRAAAIDQLEEHTNKLGVKLIKHDYNSDPAAVAFDAIEHAKAKGIDVVMIDTAGRLHSNTNLMDELKKVIRISNPDMKIFIGESTTGNDCVEQATEFDSAVGIDAIVLSKADVDENGGASISVSYVTQKPILYLGIGQSYDDLIPFNKEDMLKNLGF